VVLLATFEKKSLELGGYSMWHFGGTQRDSERIEAHGRKWRL